MVIYPHVLQHGIFVDAALNSADADLQAGTGRERSDARDDKAMPCASIQPGERSEQEQHYRHGSAEHPMLPSEAEAAGRCGLFLRLRCPHNADWKRTRLKCRPYYA